jgi:hypothetical protein
MKEMHPSFGDRQIREEYSYKINNLFKKYNFNWIALSAALSPNVFLGPKVGEEELGAVAKWYIFDSVARIGITTKYGDIHLGIISYPSMESSEKYNLIQSKGYSIESIDNHPEFIFLVKPLNDLESLISELKDIEPILLGKY